MFKRILSVVLVTSLAHLTVCDEWASANTPTEKQAKIAERVKTGINKLGVGTEARVVVKLKDKTKLSGYVSEVRDESFVITNMKTGATTTVAYMNVTQVKGHNLSREAWVGIGVAVVLVVVALTALYSSR